jgi:two-component system, OmpR family, KDP operon response regulator KdpE
MKIVMTSEHQQRQIILVLEDIEETAYLIEKMLKGNGYCVTLARTEEDAILRGRSQSPDLILMSLGLAPERLLATAHRIRQQAGLSQDVAMVIFCIPTIPEGAEMEVGKNVYVTRPDNFNQLRELLHRLLCRVPS